MTKRNITLLVLVVAVASTITILFSNNGKEIGNERGMVAEDFSLPMHGGKVGKLSDYFGDVIILNFWASWCGPCRDEMPALMELQDDYGEKGLSVVTVNMQTFERTLKDAPAFIVEMDISLPVFFDEKGYVADRYQVRNLPATYVLKRDGTIEQIIPGEATYEGLEALIVPLL
ncbi:TlpA disulfide reductase family protein [Halalkalibacter urbisdiaboli]|uniref:TlpA disulfide reductase family protein n=1 Tax=Halalkalibacter urbisdiaboli TaxID=1960589 RepID=UPI000B4338B4|nr:TlpA disulfide reductase family protein [Halalkalibacter urbisdiaboli]